MMTTVVCSKCGDPVIITNRSVVLPFVCDKHSEVTDTPLYTHKPEEKMAKKSKTQPVPEADGISNDMLLDMAAQLKTAREDLQAALDSKEFTNGLFNETMKRLEDRDAVITELSDRVRTLAEQAEELGKKNFRFSQSLVAAIAAIVELAENVRVRDIAGQQVCDELTVMQNERDAALREVKILTARNHGLYDQLDRTKKDVLYYRDMTYRYESDYIKAQHEIAQLKNRNLWQRIWQKS